MNTHHALELFRDSIRRRHLAIATEKSYCGWLRRFAGFLQGGATTGTREEKVEAFLTDLARRRCSSSQQNQALNALMSFYRDVLEQPLSGVNALRVRRPAGIRIAPSAAVVRALMMALEDTPSQPVRLIASLLYGCGLRLNEALGLRLKDVDLTNSRFWIRDAKHHRDRVVAIPCALTGDIVAQVARAEASWREDFLKRIPVPLPGLLGRKFPHAEYSRDWYWLFPVADVCTDTRSGRTVRWRCHPAVVQRAFARASERASLRPAVTPHHLRHAYATHCLDAGVNVRALQSAMGHKSLETTMRYLHADALSVTSPLDRPHCQPPGTGAFCGASTAF
ncbi:MAG: tyrosine-type recombinase/integrase [Chthoniobacterales bacterium]